MLTGAKSRKKVLQQSCRPQGPTPPSTRAASRRPTCRSSMRACTAPESRRKSSR
ncbi:MAG TPA: hypothetical protein VFS43_36925 [Polyangiaceae bacterium]|nr:hypothetical protein [Polyangiaceae bacterium]